MRIQVEFMQDDATEQVAATWTVYRDGGKWRVASVDVPTYMMTMEDKDLVAWLRGDS